MSRTLDDYFYYPKSKSYLLFILSLDLFQVKNSRGDVLQCSHYVPIVPPEEKALPCVIYCHGNRWLRDLSFYVFSLVMTLRILLLPIFSYNRKCWNLSSCTMIIMLAWHGSTSVIEVLSWMIRVQEFKTMMVVTRFWCIEMFIYFMWCIIIVILALCARIKKVTQHYSIMIKYCLNFHFYPLKGSWC